MHTHTYYWIMRKTNFTNQRAGLRGEDGKPSIPSLENGANKSRMGIHGSFPIGLISDWARL